MLCSYRKTLWGSYFAAVVEVRPAFEGVAAAAHPQRDVVLPGPREGVDHVLGLLREDDDQRVVRKELVPAESRVRVRRVVGADDSARQSRGRACRAFRRVTRGLDSPGARRRDIRRVCGCEARDDNRSDADGCRCPEQVTARKIARGQILSVGLPGTRPLSAAAAGTRSAPTPTYGGVRTSAVPDPISCKPIRDRAGQTRHASKTVTSSLSSPTSSVGLLRDEGADGVRDPCRIE